MTRITGLAPPWSPAVRGVVGALAGVGASGAMFGVTLLGRAIDIDTPVDLSGLVMVIPLIVIAAFAGALLRGPLAVAAIATGAAAAPVVAFVLMGDGCAASGFMAIGLAFFAVVGLLIGGLSASAGSRATVTAWLVRDRRLSLVVLIALSLIGMVGWAEILPSLSCR